MRLKNSCSSAQVGGLHVHGDRMGAANGGGPRKLSANAPSHAVTGFGRLSVGFERIFLIDGRGFALIDDPAANLRSSAAVESFSS